LPIGRAVIGMQAAGDRVVLLLRNSNGRGTSVTLVVGDVDGNVRQREIPLPTLSGVLPAVQLTVERSTSRAFVFSWRSRLGTPPVKVVDLTTLAVRDRTISIAGSDFDPPSIIGPFAQAFGEHGVLVSGALVPVVRDGRHVPPGGIFLLDTRTFVVRQLHPHAIQFTVAADRAYMWGFGSAPALGGRGVGLTAYGTGGQPLYQLFGTRTFARFVAAGRFGHLISRGGRQFVVDLERGRTLGSRRAPRANVEVLVPAEPAPPKRKAAAANRRDSDLRAFRRPAQSSDALPAWFRSPPAWFRSPQRSLVETRRVARYVDGRGRLARLFVAKTNRGELCHILVTGRGGGSGCSPASSFFRPGHPVAAGSGRLFAGIAADRVARIEIVGSAGRVHRVQLSPDNGFIWNCRAYNGCTCVLDSLRSYDAAGKLIGNENWRSRSCLARRTSRAVAPADPFARVSNRGTRVTPKADSPGEREHIPRDLFLLRSTEGRAVYRIGGVRPRFTSCYATGPGKAIGRLGSTACGRSGAPGFPSRTQPLLDLSMYGGERGEPINLLRLEGAAADAITEVGLLDRSGAVLERVPVVANVYLSASPPSAAVAIAAFDREGRLVYRTDRPPRPETTRPASPRRLAGFRLRLELPSGWSGQIRRSSAGVARALVLAGNRLPTSNPRSVAFSLNERYPRAQPLLRRVALPPQLTRRDLRLRGGGAEAGQAFTLKGRQFELQVAFAAMPPPAAALREVNALLRSLYVGAIATAPTRAASAPLQAGAAADVAVEVHRSGLVIFRFDRSSELYRRLQRQRLSLGCLDFDSTDAWEPNEWSTSSKRLSETVSITINDTTRPRPPYATLDPATEARPPFAGCFVSGSYGRRWDDPRGQHAPAEIAFTETARRFFDERAVARDLALFSRSPKLKTLRRAMKNGSAAPPAARIRAGLPTRVVALAEQHQLPNRGEIGIWSDRGGRVEVAAQAASGKRLFIRMREGRIDAHNLEGLAFVF
jgi:hypothetical protein